MSQGAVAMQCPFVAFEWVMGYSYRWGDESELYIYGKMQ
jgi:hypothetical protein